MHDYSKKNLELIMYYKKPRNSDKSFMQTVLVNSGLFIFSNDYKFYIDCTGSRHSYPRTLTIKDYSSLIKDEIYFARKFDITQDSKILDMLDAKILQGNKNEFITLEYKNCEPPAIRKIKEE